jgi:predicted nucleic-acid-binding protein
MIGLGTFSELLSAADMRFEDEPAIARALFMWKDSSAQFADCLIGAPLGIGMQCQRHL